jgi:hypothetical protein
LEPMMVLHLWNKYKNVTKSNKDFFKLVLQIVTHDPIHEGALK